MSGKNKYFLKDFISHRLLKFSDFTQIIRVDFSGTPKCSNSNIGEPFTTEAIPDVDVIPRWSSGSLVFDGGDDHVFSCNIADEELLNQVACDGCSPFGESLDSVTEEGWTFGINIQHEGYYIFMTACYTWKSKTNTVDYEIYVGGSKFRSGHARIEDRSAASYLSHFVRLVDSANLAALPRHC